MRSTMQLGKQTWLRTQSPSSALRSVAKATKLRRATSPLPWMLSQDITRERSQAPLPATDQSLGDQAERRSRYRPRRQVVHDVRGSGGELAGDGVDVVAAFGDGQRDDPDQRIGHPLDHPLWIIGRQQVLDDRADHPGVVRPVGALAHQGVPVSYTHLTLPTKRIV